MSPTPRAALVVGAVALTALFLPLAVALVAMLAVLVAVAVDAAAVRRTPEVSTRLAEVVSRGRPSPLRVAVLASPGPARIRQPAPPDIVISPAEGHDGIEAVLVARRRGRHVLPAAALRVAGPLGLGCAYRRAGGERELLVYPDLVAAYGLAAMVRQGQMREADARGRGPLGLGTEFELVRDYVTDDDIRQVNWRATARMGRPMSNQYRVEQDRDVLCVIDTGRLMAAPLGDRTRLDVAIDAVAAVVAVADEVGDRSGALAFDRSLRRRVSPRHRGATAIIRALFDVEPTMVDSDYELAFRTIADRRRAFVLVLTDLLEESAARPLLDAVPVLARRHVVAIASPTDPDLSDVLAREPTVESDLYDKVVVLDVLAARAAVTRQLRAAGAEVIEALPAALPAACVRSYLRAKRRARL